MLEIILRNSIDRQMIFQRGEHWLKNAVEPGGCMTSVEACEHSCMQVQEAIESLGNRYIPDRLIAQLSFGFWRFLFAPRQYAVFGSTLLEIFPDRPFGTRQKDVFKLLAKINEIRNRIAHHEPICFDGHLISTVRTANRYNLILQLLSWLGCNPRRILYGIDGVPKAINAINNLKRSINN